MKGKSRAELKASEEDLGEYKFESPEEQAFAEEQIARAEAEHEECRVSFRWQKEQLDLVKQAAEQIGIPYQTYIKLCVFRQARQDLKTAKQNLMQNQIDELCKQVAELKSGKQILPIQENKKRPNEKGKNKSRRR